MKKKLLSVLLVMAVSILLFGCECKHEWIPASCSSPQTCQKCETTEGSALEHEYGDWTDDGTYLVRTCSLCGDTEKKEPDEETLYKRFFIGDWEGFAAIVVKLNSSNFLIKSHKDEFSLTLNADGTLSGTHFYTAITGTWKAAPDNLYRDQYKYCACAETDEIGSITLYSAERMEEVLCQNKPEYASYFDDGVIEHIYINDNKDLCHVYYKRV